MYYKKDLSLTKDREQIVISNGCWEVKHDLRQGGCIAQIGFLHGSNKNILVSPISSYFSVYKKFSYQDRYEKQPQVDILEDTPDCKKIRTKGRLYRGDGRSLPVEYDYVYEYHNEYIKCIRSFICRDIKEDIHIVGVGSLELIPELDEYAYRHSHHNEVGKDFHAWLKSCPVKWGKAAEAYNPLFTDRYAPNYLAAFKRGVEGIETFPNSEIDKWEKQFTGKNGLSRFTIHRVADPARLSLLMEPYFCCHHPVRPEGKFTFTSYLGLPNITAESKQRYMHVGINNHPWPSDEQIRDWAYAGINVLRLHNCDGLPDGNYWHRGCYPSYDAEGMQELDRVIATAHTYGMKVINYFSSDLHSSAPGFKHIDEWKRIVDSSGRAAQSSMAAHFSSSMDAPDTGVVIPACLQSGFKDYLKDLIKKVLGKHKFDGVYYDCYDYNYCNNPAHSSGEHNMIDDFIEMTEWTRKAVGKDGVLSIHQSTVPSVIIENFCDAILTMEELDGERFITMDVPALEGFTPHCQYMNASAHIICPTIISRADSEARFQSDISHKGVKSIFEKAMDDFISKCVLQGVFTYPAYGGYKSVLDLFAGFRAFDLSRYRFLDYRQSPLEITGKGAKGALYYNDKEALIVLSNPACTDTMFSWRLDATKLGWAKSASYLLVDSLGKAPAIIENKEIQQKGIKEALSGYQYRVYRLKEHIPDMAYVQYSTYPYNEQIISDIFRVITEGPMKQEVVLDFYTPQRPERVKINGMETSGWEWNNKAGKVVYRMTGREITLDIDFGKGKSR